MAYGHAEGTLATIRLLEAVTRELLSRLANLDLEQSQWLQDAAARRLHSAGTERLGADPPRAHLSF
jgi:hypothetical protein